MSWKGKGRLPTPIVPSACEPHRQRYQDRGATIRYSVRVRIRSRSFEEAGSRPSDGLVLFTSSFQLAPPTLEDRAPQSEKGVRNLTMRLERPLVKGIAAARAKVYKILLYARSAGGARLDRSRTPGSVRASAARHSRREPERVYPHFDEIAGLLNHTNHALQWNAIRTLAHLAPVDCEGKLDGILDAYLAPIDGPVMITAANAARRRQNPQPATARKAQRCAASLPSA